jgi:hypothetical protein
MKKKNASPIKHNGARNHISVFQDAANFNGNASSMYHVDSANDVQLHQSAQGSRNASLIIMNGASNHVNIEQYGFKSTINSE